MGSEVIIGSYAHGLVALSVVIAILASYVALDLAGRVTTATGAVRSAWLIGGAVAMGTGIWSMHYIGMLAFRLPVPVQYDWPTVVLSLFAAIVSSAVALFVTSQTTMGWRRAFLGSMAMGIGIASMHYIGMAAMRLPALHSYSPALVTLSVVLAIGISFVALWLTFRLKGATSNLSAMKVGGAILMGAAIPVMHYTAMAAVSFTSMPTVHGDLSHAVSISSLGATSIIGVTFLVLGLAVVTSVIDRRLSEQVMREDALLRRSEARLRADAERRDFILNAAAIGFWEQDLVTGEVTWSNTMEAIHGVSLEKFPTDFDSFLALIHPDDRAGLTRQFGDFLRTGSPYSTEYRSVRADGSVRWVETTARVIEDAPGTPTRIVGIDRDVTERRLTDAALIESERAYRSTFEGAPAGMAHVSLDGRWLRVNQLLCELLGYTREELLQLDVLGLTHPEDVAAEKAAVQEVAAGRRDAYRREGRLRRRDGTFVWTLLNVAVHRDEAGRPKYMVRIVSDITERKMLETQFRHSQKMEAIGQLAGGVAHDFSNLLTVIIGFSGMLLNDLEPDNAARSDVEEILNAAQRASALTGQLLAFSRRQTLEPRILDLNTVVRDMETMLRRLIGEHVDLALCLAPGLGRVNGDKGQIEQIIMNLVVNARDAMPEGGTLRIETSDADLGDTFISGHTGSPRGPHVAIAVSDTGIGMDAAVQSHLFEPFFTTKDRGRGTGLGLATVYGIVKQSNGFIDVNSEVGRGSTFTVYLPHVAQSAPSAGPEPSLLAVNTGTETILLVEDQDDVRRTLFQALVRHGYIVVEARNGHEALHIVREHPTRIDLVLTDVVMPGMDGRQLGRQLGIDRRDLPVLYMSGYAPVAGRDDIAESTVTFLRKPFTPITLLQRIREVLDANTSRWDYEMPSHR